MRSRSERGKGDERGGGDQTPVEGGDEAVDASGIFVVCSGLVLEVLAVVCPGKYFFLFIEARVNMVESSEAGDVIDGVVEKVEPERSRLETL